RAVFRMVGTINVLPAARAALAADVELTGPVPRSEIPGHYAWADVFLLPSICEGSATVTYEALAAGLPVVCTPNTGSVVRDGVDGFVVPAGDTDALVGRLDQLRDPGVRAALAARAAAGTEHSVDSYRHRLLRALSSPAAGGGAR